MAIAEIPKQVKSSAEEANQRLKEWAESLNARDRRRMRVLGAVSLLTGAMLLAGGRRKAALGLAAAGTVLVILEDPKAVVDAWAALPSCIEAGERFLGRLEGFVETVAAQEQRVRGFVDRLQR